MRCAELVEATDFKDEHNAEIGIFGQTLINKITSANVEQSSGANQVQNAVQKLAISPRKTPLFQILITKLKT